jgi:hypothetical protein
MAAYSVMRILILVTSAVLAASAGSSKPAVPDEISRLHECIAARFLDTRAFGMSRIVPSRHRGLLNFRPESPREQDVVSSLREKGYTVVLYLAGRGVLDPARLLRPTVQGPAFITPSADYPQPANLLALAQNTLQNGRESDVVVDGWTVSMRLLYATNQRCVACHASSKVKLGDPLGTAIYAYRR